MGPPESFVTLTLTLTPALSPDLVPSLGSRWPDTGPGYEPALDLAQENTLPEPVGEGAQHAR